MIKLDAIELSDRMRTYRVRPIERVKPRSKSKHLQKRVGMEVWEPIPESINNCKPKNPTRKITTRIPTPQNIKNPNVNELNSRLLVPLRLDIQKKITTQHNDFSNHSDDSLSKTIDFTESARDWKKQKKSKSNILGIRFKKPKLINFVLYSMAVIVFVVGIVAAIRSFMVDNKISQTVSAQAVGQNNEVDETKPSDDQVRSYSVAPDMPKTISINKLNINARIRQLNVKSDGSLDAPSNIHDAGWYSQSAKPGSPGGATIIDGHVSGPTQKGVFYKIETLKNGDQISIELGNGSKINYRVVKVEVAKASDVDMSKMLLPITPGLHGLNLITCTGKFDASTKTYQDRALVFAEVIK